MLSVFLQISLPPNLFNLQTEIQEAMDLFTKMKLDNLQVQPEIYGELLQGCVYALDLSTGQQIHDRIGSSETCCKSMGFCEEALLGLLELLDSGHFPDNFVVPNALKACGAFQWIGMGKGIHGYAIKMGYGNGICVFVSSSLGDMYGKCGAMEDARMVFDGIPEKNVVTWNSLMVGYLSASANIAAPDEGKQGHAMAIVEAFNLGSSKVSLIEDAGLVFSKMAEKYANNLKLGKEGLINSIRVGPDNSGNYVALSNAYAAVGQWDKLKNKFCVRNFPTLIVNKLLQRILVTLSGLFTSMVNLEQCSAHRKVYLGQYLLPSVADDIISRTGVIQTNSTCTMSMAKHDH
ncbi:hypothetical protein G4B88_021291 [Cannabis sativa]|uniref:Pentatricopeptide repeat-containing protein n=1 Tax=Cannabis sativa TaxID=3483 RepID=A0A7J6HXU3_CANSA|nr:hypothetical protein G4B88_021291 [Cannabis sativa]